jgi:ABC-type transport system involved in cytochrome c biogenesis permease subunit
MTQEEQQAYPVRTMHEFLYQVERETNRFKRGAIISILISALMLVVLVAVAYITMQQTIAASGIILLAVLAAVLTYSIYLMTFQYRFFHTWEKRLNQLNKLEEKLMQELIEEKATPEKP